MVHRNEHGVKMMMAAAAVVAVVEETITQEGLLRREMKDVVGVADEGDVKLMLPAHLMHICLWLTCLPAT